MLKFSSLFSKNLLNRQFSKAIGIDLGTTNSCVAVLEGGQPKVLENSEGMRTTPSVVSFSAKGETLVGAAAMRQAIIDPENTFYATKRLIGRRYDDPTIQSLGYKLIESPNGDAWVEAHGKKYSPSQIGAFILMKMKDTAESYLGEEVKKAVITVPACFNDPQRRATIHAGQIAGLEVQSIINEPTATALSYVLGKNMSKVVAVFDLGGGTFDISILEISQGVFEVKATNGDSALGGEDFNNVLQNYIFEEFKKETKIDLKLDRIALQRIRDAAEKAKIEISSSLQTEINEPYIIADKTGPKHLNMKLTRDKYEELTGHLIDRIKNPCEVCLKDAGIKKSQLEEILLVGGMTRMPRVQEFIKEYYGKPGSKKVNSSEAVAMGAAIQAEVLKGEMGAISFLDVTSLSLGIEFMGNISSRVINRCSKIPIASRPLVFTTVTDNQAAIPIRILQGEREMANENKLLGIFNFTGIPPMPQEMPRIEVTFDIDANGLVHAKAKEKNTGEDLSVTVISSGGLKEADIEMMAKDAERLRADDEKRRNAIDTKNEAENTIYNIEKTFNKYKEKIPENVNNDIIQAISELKENTNEDNVDGMRVGIDKIKNLSLEIEKIIY